MRLQLISDLHLESRAGASPVLEDFVGDGGTRQDCLVIAGDVGDPFHPSYERLLEQAVCRFGHVIVVPGNHEHYFGTVGAVHRRLKCLEQELDGKGGGGRLHVMLEGKTVLLAGSIRVIGDTMWSHVPAEHAAVVQAGMNDYRYIRRDDGGCITVSDTNEWLRRAVIFIQDELIKAASRGERAIVVTHHLPSFLCVSERFKGSVLNHAFATPLDHILRSGLVRAWLFGHTHDRCDLRVSCPNGAPDCRLVCNPVGYLGENAPTWSDVFIEL